MVRNHYKDGKLVESAEQHALRLIDKRIDANKKGLPNAVKRYMKRTGFNPNPPVLNGDI